MLAVKTERALQLVIAVCLAVLAWAIWDTFPERIVVVGDTAPEFSITADNGRTITRSNFGGKLLVLNFWATWCLPCVEEIPSLDQFQKAFAGNVTVLGISVDQNQAAYRNFLGKTRPAFLTARDPSAKISSDYGTYKYPETYIINSEGKVVEKIIGPTTWTDPNMVARVKALLGS